MIHQPPAGARDLLPLEVVQKGWINDRIQEVFGQWGYQRIVTSTIEWLDTLMAGGAIERGTVIQLREESEGTLGLRPELTASIARAAVTRMADSTYPQRLCYRANVFRNPPPGYHGRQLEFYQAGVELLFAGGVLADAEILLLLADCLDKIGLQQWQLLLGEAGLTRSLLSAFPPSLRQQVRYCIARLDHIALENLNYPSLALKEQAIVLFDLRGKPADVLQALMSFELDEVAHQIVNNLKSLVELLEKSCAKPFPLILDLSLLQTFDYYTGIVFKAVSRGGDRLHILGQGGRYDELLSVYHPQSKASPGIGFSLNLEDLHVCLLSTSALPEQTPPIDWLIVPKTPQAEATAFIYAQNLKNSDPKIRVEIDLGGRSPEGIRDYARSCRILRLAWVEDDGSAIVETVD
jgi:ATP phosphoribosyltransferase regulatory subunit